MLDDGGILGEYGFTDNVFWFMPDCDNAGGTVVTMAVTDGVDTSSCEVLFSFACCAACCCGKFTNGHTGNCDCDPEGIRNLTDVTRLIDYIYLSRAPLCCEANGNVDGDAENKINLIDVTRLIDHIYLSKSETVNCP